MSTELRAYVQRNIHDTDVFCFQEARDVDQVAYQDLFEAEFFTHSVERVMDKVTNWYGNVMYIRKSLKLLDTGSLFMNDTSGYEIGLVAHATIEVNKKPLVICNVHGIPVPGHKLDTPARLYQSETILNTFKSSDAVVIGGDFNLLPEAKSIAMFEEYGYRNLISDYEIATTRNRITFEKYPDNIQYYADYAFTSPRVNVVDFVVPDDVVSDHQPLELTITTSL